MASTEAHAGKILIANEDVFKKYVVEEIKSIADPDSADSDVLADYVFALVQSEKSLDSLRGNFMENLDDFLGDNTSKFAEKLLNALATGSYDPSLAQSQQQSSTLGLGNPGAGLAPQGMPTGAPLSETNANAPPAGPRAMMRGPDGFKPPSGPAAMLHSGMNHPSGNRLGFGRKRERDRSASVDPSDSSFSHSTADDRIHKQRRGMGPMNGPRGKPHWNGHQNQNHHPQQQHQQHRQPQFGYPGPVGNPMQDMNGSNNNMMYPGFPMPVPGQPLPFDPAMMQAAMMSMGMEGFPAQLQALLGGMAQGGVKPDEYDPANASLPGAWRGSNRGRGRGRGDRTIGRGGRAEFSSTAPNQDRSITTVVVENIPSEHFTEDQVREYFFQFGVIKELTLQSNRRLALVNFESYDSAQSAYSSPKSIFENRFVKVYWYKPESEKQKDAGESSQPPRTPVEAAAPTIDYEDIERKQQAFKDRQAKLQAAEQERKDVEAKLKKQEEERKRLMEILNAAEASQTAAAAGSSGDVVLSETEALKAKLKELEQEATQLGLDSSAPSYRGRGAFRGGYRGRFPTRARGRGRGGFMQPMFSAVKRLDNRTKRVTVSVAAGTQRDEMLRQYLINNFNFEGVEAHPEKTDSQIVSFSERYLAENFFKAALSGEIANLGKIETSWAPAAPAGSSADASKAPSGIRGSEMVDVDNNMDTDMVDAQIGGVPSTTETATSTTGAAAPVTGLPGMEPDYDVADAS